MQKPFAFCLLPFVFCLSLLSAGAATDNKDWPTGNRTTPPTINSVAPLGLQRGATMELTVEGLNLANTKAIHFSEPGIKARIVRIKELPDLPDIRLGSNGTPSTIDLGPLPPRNQVTLELEISPDAVIGPVGLRLETPLGTSPEARVVVEPYYGESPDREPNDTPEEALETFTPTILVGAISRPGDFDYYKINVKAGEELVFENAAPMLGSALQPVIEIYDASQSLLARHEEKPFAHKFDKAGAYYIRIADYQSSGSARHFYRIKVGKFPLLTSAYPLGLQRGKTAEIALAGYNLPASKITAKGDPSPEAENALILRPKGAFNEIKLAIDDQPAVEASGKSINIPAAINGKLKTAQQDFRFHARKGQKLVFEVEAARYGSQLDSLVEVLDSAGKPVERATIRCLLETSVTLRDHDSSGSGIRINSPAGFAAGDLMMLGGEIIEVEAMPRTPDDDFRFVSFGGQRLGKLDTTPEAHALDSPVYKVQVHPPGKTFAPNGLPVVHMAYRNDDGGSGYGKDSRLRFTAPADGDYIVRLRDVRGQFGDDYPYRLLVRDPAPDFRLSVNPRNPNIPVGGRIPLTITALRLDDFDGPIEVELQDLPAGFTSTKAVIGSGQISTTLLLAAQENARLAGAVPLKVRGRAGALEHWASPEDKLKIISLMPKPDIVMTAETKEVMLAPGGTAEVKVSIHRNNNFGGRVPVEVRNLPPGVRVLDVGLNGVLINEDENQRSFTLEALESAEPIEQPIVLSGNIETRAGGQQTSYASEAVRLRVTPRVTAAKK
jgi:hypothetical protein